MKPRFKENNILACWRSLQGSSKDITEVQNEVCLTLCHLEICCRFIKTAWQINSHLVALSARCEAVRDGSTPPGRQNTNHNGFYTQRDGQTDLMQQPQHKCVPIWTNVNPIRALESVHVYNRSQLNDTQSKKKKKEKEKQRRRNKSGSLCF